MTDNTNTNDDDLTGLKNKVKELLGLVKTANERAEKAEQERNEATERAADANATELEKAVKRADRAEKAAQDAAEREVQAGKTLRTYKAESAIASALAVNNVDTKHNALLTKALKADIEYNDAGDAMIEGKAVGDYLKSYFARDGLSYVRASDNSGSGSTGSGQSRAARMTKENFTFDGFAKIQLENPAEANAIADEIGRPELKTQL
jgi:hypothetical protein